MRYKKVLDKRKGIAGLELLMSMVAMLFMIGIIIMVFVIAGAKLQEAVSTADFLDGATVSNETNVNLNTTGHILEGGHAFKSESFVIVQVWNETSADLLGAGNYAVDSSTGVITNASDPAFAHQVNVTYTYNYLADRTAYETVNDTSKSLSGVVDWFPTFIILGAMVVLILLVVIIITSIKRSKITEGA